MSRIVNQSIQSQRIVLPHYGPWRFTPSGGIMNTRHKLISGLFALSAILPLSVATGPVQAQQSAAARATPRIDGFDVRAAPRAGPGNELAFTLYGSPGGSAAVRIDGATTGLALIETDAGVYEGTYTIRTRDRISATSTATANLRLGNNVASAILDEPMIGRSNGRRNIGAADGAPRIDRFEADVPERLVAGEEVILTMSGTPGAVASGRITGVAGKLVLTEVRPGTYEGSYTINRRDRITADSVVTGNLRQDGRETNMVLQRKLASNNGYRSNARPAVRACANCGVVEAVNLVEVKGEGGYLGKIGGGLAGVLIGSQIGQGRGTTAAQIAGAVGGAVAGNEVQRRMTSSKHYEVVVRLDNGGTQTFSYEAQPAFTVGSRVQVDNGTLVSVRT